MIKKLNLMLLTMFGVGYIKYAPGTFASFLTCILYFVLIYLDNFWIWFFYYFLFILIVIYSIVLVDKMSKHFSEVDAQEIVIDEFIGQSIPIISLLIIFEINDKNFNISSIYDVELLLIIISFILFRFFDTSKPYPINIIDKKFKSGFGVIFDDILAGIYTAVIILIPLIYSFF